MAVPPKPPSGSDGGGTVYPLPGHGDPIPTTPQKGGAEAPLSEAARRVLEESPGKDTKSAKGALESQRVSRGDPTEAHRPETAAERIPSLDETLRTIAERIQILKSDYREAVRRTGVAPARTFFDEDNEPTLVTVSERIHALQSEMRRALPRVFHQEIAGLSDHHETRQKLGMLFHHLIISMDDLHAMRSTALQTRLAELKREIATAGGEVQDEWNRPYRDLLRKDLATVQGALRDIAKSQENLLFLSDLNDNWMCTVDSAAWIRFLEQDFLPDVCCPSISFDHLMDLMNVLQEKNAQLREQLAGMDPGAPPATLGKDISQCRHALVLQTMIYFSLISPSSRIPHSGIEVDKERLLQALDQTWTSTLLFDEDPIRKRLTPGNTSELMATAGRLGGLKRTLLEAMLKEQKPRGILGKFFGGKKPGG